MRKDYIVALTGAGSGPDPDQNLHLLYGCGAIGTEVWMRVRPTLLLERHGSMIV
jgi:hypothetical protein